MNPLVIDVSAGMRTVDPHAFAASLDRARRFSGRPVESPNRHDGGWAIDADGIDAYHRHVDGLLIRDAQLERGQRWTPSDAALRLLREDAFPAGAGGFPRDFEFIRAQIFEEKRQPLTASFLFPADTSVPLGARRHTARRSLGSGEAQIYRAGSEIPRARTTYVEETFGVAYIVCAVDVQYFDALTTDWAGLQQYQRDLRLALRLVDERKNALEWSGDVGAQIHGILDYPALPKEVLTTAFTDDSAPEDVMLALTDLANTPMIESGGTFRPNRCAVSPKIHAFLFTRKHLTTGGSDLTIGEYFLRGQAASGGGVRSIDVAPELAGVGPDDANGNPMDGILFYRDDLDTVGRVEIQSPTVLPVYQSGPLEQTTVVFAATGGVVMPDVGNCILGFAEVDA